MVATSLGALVAPVLLAVGPLRRALNRMYLTASPRVAGMFTVLLGPAKPRSDFLWTGEVAGRKFVIPVRRELERAWSDALLWRWPPALPMRAILETYLDAREPAVLLDVGANDGMVTLPFAAHGWRCFAFEPQESCLRHIAEISEANGFDNVTTVRSVVTDEAADAVEFYVSDSSWYSSLSRDMVARFEAPRAVSMPAVTIDAFVQENALNVTFMKIDVEGAEAAVLRGALQTLDRDRPDLLVETSDAARREEVWRLLQPLGYRFFAITDSAAEPLRRIDNEASFVASAGKTDSADFIVTMAADLWH